MAKAVAVVKRDRRTHHLVSIAVGSKSLHPKSRQLPTPLVQHPTLLPLWLPALEACDLVRRPQQGGVSEGRGMLREKHGRTMFDLLESCSLKGPMKVTAKTMTGLRASQ